MKRGSFIIDGVSSETVNTLIQSRPAIEAPLRKVEWTSPYGTDGDIPFDEGAYSNTSMDLYMLTDGNNAIQDRQALYNLLDGRGVYKDFIPYFDPDKIYRVMLNDKVSFDSRYYLKEVQSLSVKFTVKPYKYLVDNDPIIMDEKNGQAINPTNYTSQPIIKIFGTGPVTLKVNGFEYNIKEVEDTITLSSERYAAYQEYITGILSNMNHQIMFKEYPVLEPGVNNIEVIGDVTRVVIEPRWRSLV